MEATELMIGDYVKFKDDIYIFEEISAQGWVHLIYPDTGIRVNIISDYIMHLLKPIPLTKEILEEKGYSIDEDGFNQAMKVQKDNARNRRAKTNYKRAR